MGSLSSTCIRRGLVCHFHINANEVIANRATELLGGEGSHYALCHPNDHANCSQSTNDVFPTAMRLASVFLFDDVLRAVAELAKSFSRKASAFDRILKSGRTRLMDAVPIRPGPEFAPYAIAMRRCGGVLEYAFGLLK
jgi:aspartate ammonia-lyase